MVDFPKLGLKKFSRLIPTRDLQDVAGFEFKETPFSASFWVLSLEGRLVHDCPLMDAPGIGLEMWSLDIMHGWHLGPLQQLVSMSLNYCLETSLWAPPTLLDAEERRRLGLLAIKAELHQWYKLQRLDPEWRAKGSEASRLKSLCFETWFLFQSRFGTSPCR